MQKEATVDATTYEDVAGDDGAEVSEKKGTPADRHSMWRMGKNQSMRVCSGTAPKYHPVRQWLISLQRNFRFVSIFGFSMILMASWETMLG